MSPGGMAGRCRCVSSPTPSLRADENDLRETGAYGRVELVKRVSVYTAMSVGMGRVAPDTSRLMYD